MKEVLRENAEHLLEVLEDIGSGLWWTIKGTLKMVYAILILWCSIWVALGGIVFELFTMFCDWTAKQERERHYGKGV